MTRITFADLVAIYRDTRFDGQDGDGTLLVANEEIVKTLHKITQDDALYDDAQVSVPEDTNLIVGTNVRIKIGQPTIKLGLLLKSFDDLFGYPSSEFMEPKSYYIIADSYAQGDCPAPETLKRYRALLPIMSILREAASYIDDVQRELVFIGSEKIVIPVHFTASHLTSSLNEQSGRLSKIFDDSLHKVEKANLLAAAVIDIVGKERRNQRFPQLINNLDRICDEVEKGYRLFVSSFSYSKIRNEVESARHEYLNKIHKTIVDIQGQLLGIPVATIVVASQLKQSEGCGFAFYTNVAVLLGAWIFVALLYLAVTNQRHTLTALSNDIDSQRRRLREEYAAVSDQFSDVFNDIEKRLAWHRKVMIAILIMASLGAILTSYAFKILSERSLKACLWIWV